MENQKENDLFFTISLIEFIARHTNNTKQYVIQKLGLDNIKHIFEFADIIHCENILEVIDRYVEKCSIEIGSYKFDRFTYQVPTEWSIGRVYQRLVLATCKDKDWIEHFIDIANSWIGKVIDNYDGSFYYESLQYQIACYEEGKILDK